MVSDKQAVVTHKETTAPQKSMDGLAISFVFVYPTWYVLISIRKCENNQLSYSDYFFLRLSFLSLPLTHYMHPAD
jgi:hypothetical protein